jgi:hypothetical protein
MTHINFEPDVYVDLLSGWIESGMAAFCSIAPIASDDEAVDLIRHFQISHQIMSFEF